MAEKRFLTTVERHSLDRPNPHATEEFSWLLSGITLATKIISAYVRRAGLLEVLGATGQINVQGEEVQKLDEFANETLVRCLGYRGNIGLLVSEEDIGLATVYRVLTQFEAAGLVTRHHFEGGMAVFELNHGAHHDHIVCADCGKVEEFMDGGIEERQQAVAKRLGFEISDHSLILYGHCRKPNCPNQKRPRQ